MNLLAMASSTSPAAFLGCSRPLSLLSCRSYETGMPCFASLSGYLSRLTTIDIFMSVYRHSLMTKASSFAQVHKARVTVIAPESAQNSSSREMVVMVGADSPLAQEEAPSEDEVSKLKLESDLLKRRKKREELRRKRLVRKRHLRKKGRWPPAKMAKNKNI